MAAAAAAASTARHSPPFPLQTSAFINSSSSSSSASFLSFSYAYISGSRSFDRLIRYCYCSRKIGIPHNPQHHPCFASVSGVASSAQYAKEMERIAAKEALILAIKDNGGFGSLNTTNPNNAGSIDINERILALERLNPTPRPTTSPLLEGLWEFQWSASQSPASTTFRYLTTTLPSTLASINTLNLSILGGSAKATAILKILGTIDSSFTLTTKLTVEGPIRLKEEYVEGLLMTPTIPEDAVPSQLKGLYDQVISSIQGLPDAFRETLSGGLKIPLATAGTFQRQLLISYLDDEILIARDVFGAPDVLSRVEGVAVVSAESLPEYVS